jgi:hypothetical protein
MSETSLFDRIWRVAAETFSKGRGHDESLNPYRDDWRKILARVEHAIFLWNDKYGPLNHAQREYAGDIVCYALVNAREAPTPSERYAWFNRALTGSLNHERVDAGFKQRDDGGIEPTFLGDVLGVTAAELVA